MLVFGLCFFGGYLTFINKQTEAGMAAIGVGVSIATMKQDENSSSKKLAEEYLNQNHLKDIEITQLKMQLKFEITIEKQNSKIEYLSTKNEELKAQFHLLNSQKILQLPSNSDLKLNQEEQNNINDLNS